MNIDWEDVDVTKIRMMRDLVLLEQIYKKHAVLVFPEGTTRLDMIDCFEARVKAVGPDCKFAEVGYVAYFKQGAFKFGNLLYIQEYDIIVMVFDGENGEVNEKEMENNVATQE